MQCLCLSVWRFDNVLVTLNVEMKTEHRAEAQLR